MNVHRYVYALFEDLLGAKTHEIVINHVKCAEYNLDEQDHPASMQYAPCALGYPSRCVHTIQTCRPLPLPSVSTHVEWRSFRSDHGVR